MTPHQEMNCLTKHCAEMGLPGHYCPNTFREQRLSTIRLKIPGPSRVRSCRSTCCWNTTFQPRKEPFILSSSKIAKSGNLDMLRSSCFILWDTHFAHTHSQTHIHAYTHTHMPTYTSIFTYEEELMTTGKISHCQLLLVKKFCSRNIHTASNFFQSLM